MNIAIPYNYTPRNYQMPLWRFFETGGRRGVAVWHRRAGKDLLALNLSCTMMMERPGLYWHLLPTYNQGRKIVWNGFTREGRAFLDYFPKDLIQSKNDTDMRIKLKTGSIYQVVGTDDPDRLVGTNPIGCVFSEYSLQDPKAWDIIRPILAENEGFALFIYTARGKNHGYDMIEMAKRNPKWFAEILVAGDQGTKREDGTPVLSDEIIEDERLAGMPEELIQQEFYCSFDAPTIGAYYGKQMMIALEDDRITKVPWEPRLKVHTAWDLGMDDAMTIWFFQQQGMETRLIDYYENSGEGFPHYAKIMNEGRRGEYVYGYHYAPHDISIRELGAGKSRKQAARELGIKFITVKKHNISDGIEAVRNLLPSCWFDEDLCARGIETLRQYRKEWDDQRMCYQNRPLHDWASHGADAMRTLACGLRKTSRGSRNRRQQSAEDDYDYLAA